MPGCWKRSKKSMYWRRTWTCERSHSFHTISTSTATQGRPHRLVLIQRVCRFETKKNKCSQTGNDHNSCRDVPEGPAPTLKMATTGWLESFPKLGAADKYESEPTQGDLMRPSHFLSQNEAWSTFWGIGSEACLCPSRVDGRPPKTS